MHHKGTIDLNRLAALARMGWEAKYNAVNGIRQQHQYNSLCKVMEVASDTAQVKVQQVSNSCF